MSGRKCLVLSILLAAVMTGCGGQLNYAAVGTPATDPLQTSQTGSTSNQGSNLTTTNPYTQSPTAQTPTTQGALEIKDVTKETTGLIFKKLVVKGRVYNSSASPLSATLQVVFTKNNVVSGDIQTKTVSELAPGQSLSFTFTSTSSSDSGELSIVGQR